MEDGDREKTEPPMGAVLARNQWASNSQDRMGYVKRRLGRAFRGRNTSKKWRREVTWLLQEN